MDNGIQPVKGKWIGCTVCFFRTEANLSSALVQKQEAEKHPCNKWHAVNKCWSKKLQSILVTNNSLHTQRCEQMPKQEAEKHHCKLSNRQTSQCQEAEKHPRVIAAQIFQLSWTEEKPELIKRLVVKQKCWITVPCYDTTVLARWQLSTRKTPSLETIDKPWCNCRHRSVRLEAIEKSQTAESFLGSVCL